ncbi:MAG: sigma 54-interacting transcriptional regulator [Sporolactobacillus sp.]
MVLELRHIQSTIQQIVSAIASVMKIEVEVADAQLFRVAGTGLIKQKIWQGMSGEDAVYQQCVEKGEMIIIDRPGHHTLCRHCPHFENCMELGEICTPIKINDTVIGVIGLIAFDEPQRGRLFDDLDANTFFIKKMAEVIATKVNETIIFQQQLISEKKISTLINCIDMGVIMCNRLKGCEFVSTIAHDMLQLTGDPNHDQGILQQVLDRKISGKQGHIVWITLGSFQKKFFITAHPVVGLAHGDETEVILIEDPDHITQNASHIRKEKQKEAFELIGSTPQINSIKHIFSKLKDESIPVLISGENGTGKTSAARYLHALGQRPTHRFSKLNVSFYSEADLNAILFTGKENKPPLLERLDGGTLVLDEVDKLGSTTQLLLLQFLTTHILPGNDNGKQLSLRLISLTTCQLLTAVQNGQFRQDLYYRIGVVPIHMPPLKKRKSDVMALSSHFLAQFCAQSDPPVHKNFMASIQEVMLAYDWPGNIQELYNAVDYAFNLADEAVIRPQHLPDYILANYERTLKDTDKTFNLQVIEQETIRKALVHIKNEGRKKEEAAALLGIGRATLFRKIAVYHLSD